MKSFFAVLLLLHLHSPLAYAEEELPPEPVYGCGGFLNDAGYGEEDPFECLNRGIFWINQGIDYLIIEPIALVYKELIPAYGRDRISYILRNLNEPVVLANNFLQGDLEDARGTIWRFLINTTIGVVGIFDVATDLGFPYKKEDLGLTFASWGVCPGPYLILPILGPSTVRDGIGRLGDYSFDPINWWVFGIPSTAHTSTQILDAKADNIEITNDIKKNAIDHYASIRAWYIERREDLLKGEKGRELVDTPRPDDDD